MTDVVEPKEEHLPRHLLAHRELETLDPAFADAAEALFGHPHRKSVLTPRVRALLVLAAEAVIPQADAPRLTRAIEQAGEDGATVQEVLCILEIACSIGLHSISVGLPILIQEMAAVGLSLPNLTDRHLALRERFESSGPRPRPVNPIYAAILRIDPDYFEHRVRFIDLPWERLEVLDPQVKHLASIAIDAVSPQHYADGLTKHVREALTMGVAPAEILETLQLVSVTGLRTLDVGLPAMRSVFGSPLV